jgi:predicted RNA binding protein YcfA (HicA-like mRNA interferase family)
MKRKEFIKLLEEAGCILKRHGSRHDIYLNLKNGKKQPEPRYSEIDEQLVRHIKKHLNISG